MARDAVWPSGLTKAELIIASVTQSGPCSTETRSINCIGGMMWVLWYLASGLEATMVFALQRRYIGDRRSLKSLHFVETDSAADFEDTLDLAHQATFEDDVRLADLSHD